MQRRDTGATYIASNRILKHPSSGAAKQVLSALAAFLILFLMLSSVGIAPQTAYAIGEDSGASEESDAASDNAWSVIDGLNPVIPEDSQNDGFLLGQVGSYKPTDEVSSFQGLLWSMFGLRYINRINNATVPSSAADMASRLGLSNPSSAVYACRTNQIGAGTAYYHNCDVPNLMTEFLQDSFKVFDRSGAQNAESRPAYAGDLFGLPKNLPGDGAVPVNSDFRSEKYTGLELYGYSLPWTTYLGEWDHIKTQSEARLLSNFGFFDNLGLTGNAIGNSIATGLNVAVDNFSGQISGSGNIFNAIGGFYAGYYQGAATGAIAPILDSSDLNVILSFAWYRVGYANTTYGLRQLSDIEIASSIRLTFLQMMAQSNPDGAGIGAALLEIADGGKPPRKPVSKCEVLSVSVSGDGSAATGSWVEESPPTADQLEDPEYLGLLQADCSIAAQGSYSNWINAENYDGIDPSGNAGTQLADFFRYDADGNREADTVGTWRAWNSEALASAAALEIDCSATYPSDTALADSIWLAFGDCWGGSVPGGANPGTGYTGGNPAGSVDSPYAWNIAANREFEDNQGAINTDWIADVLSQVMVQSFMQANQEAMNFNAPWRRYVCLNSDGTDMMTNVGGLNVFVYAFTIQGNVNPACNAEFRAPVQNALFGSGYSGGPNQNPANDTRHISNFGDPIGIVVTGTIAELAANVQSITMGVGQFATKLSGEAISWTYMPILDSLGITDILIGLIEGFRDSLFFPLASMVIAFAAVGILWRAFKDQAYREGFVSVIMICLIYISGAFLMYKTTDVIDFVQGAPAIVEEAIVGSIFSASSVGNDELCTSTAGAVSASGNIFGRMADTSASEATRELICYNWRTFTFTPWVYGQFGAGFESLYANGATAIPANASTWNNTNESLVGAAGVNMGNGTVVQNWALYQLDILKTGTATTADDSIANGRVDPNFYRIIDAQFGPNNGAGTDSRFQDAWSASNQGERFLISSLSTTLAIFGAFVVIAYSLTKIVITLLSTLMLVFIPFAFLLGLFPSKRPKLKDYFLTIAGLMIQRIVLIIVLSIFFVLLLTFAGTGQGNYLNTFLMGMLTVTVFWLWRKDIMGYVFSSIGNPQFGRQLREDPGAAMRQWPILKTAMQKVDQLSDTRTAIASAAIGSVLAGRAPIGVSLNKGKLEFTGAIAEEVKSRNALLFRKQRRREGFEGIRSGLMSAKAVADETRTDAKLDDATQEALKELFRGAEGQGVTPDEDLEAQADVYDMLKNTPGFSEVRNPVMQEGVHLKDASGYLRYDNVVVADDDPAKIVATEPMREGDLYDRLEKPQDRRLAQQYKELENESMKLKEKKVQTAEKLNANPDPRTRQVYDQYSSASALPSLQEFRSEKDSKKRAALAKKLEGAVAGDLDAILLAIDSELPDSEGYTEGDRRKVKKAIQSSVKDNLAQENIEHKMKRIQEHLQYVAQQEYAASNPRRAAKEAVRDMNEKLEEAAAKAAQKAANSGGGNDG